MFSNKHIVHPLTILKKILILLNVWNWNRASDSNHHDSNSDFNESNTPLHLFQFLHAALTLCVISVAMPPVPSTLEPICTLCNSSPGILTGFLPWPLSCQKLKSMNWVLSTHPSGVGTGTSEFRIHKSLII